MGDYFDLVKNIVMYDIPIKIPLWSLLLAVPLLVFLGIKKK